MKSSVLYFLFLLVLSFDASGQTTDDIESQVRSGNAFSQFTLGEDYCLGNNGKMKDETKALKWLNLSLKNGLDPQYKGKAYRYIAFCYGRRKKYHQSMEWLKKAVALNDAEAQLEMGWFYQNGFDVAQDMVQAVSWYRKAAEQGLAQAQHNLGVCYYDGKGVGADYYQAVFWYRKAAKQGHAVAQNNLGLCYYRGHGVEKDDAKAKYWWKLSDEQGNSIARGNLKFVANVSLPISNPDIDDSATILVAEKNPIENNKVDNVIQPSEVDYNIPYTANTNQNVFAVVIGNEKYTQVAQVPHADNDAKIFAAYCEKTLGLPKQNIKLYENATYGTMIEAVSNIQKIANAYKGDIKVIFYYAGHGIPDEASKEAYLLPVDANGMRMEVCYPLSRLYSELAKMNTKNVTVFLDACFSGAQRGDGMLMAARGVAIKPKSNALTGNLVVFSAATDQQTAYPYKEKGHGMFTYYLLKKLSATRGECTLGELGSYVCDEVAKQAIVFNGKEQTPVVQASPQMQNTWRNLKLK